MVDLGHHGDAEARGAQWDFAVNVFPGPRPGWLDSALHDAIDASATYPDASSAQRDVAEYIGCAPENVLLTAGAAEAFTLLARAHSWSAPTVVHPQFTEPHAALVAAGYNPASVILDADNDFALDVSAVPEAADLVVVGNPTNPTGVLHPVAAIQQLRRPGRVLLVDEAFIDTVPDTGASILANPDDLAGLVIVRSLTKHWSIPGIRAGFAVGDADVIAQMRRAQPPWSLSTPAIAALSASCSETARQESQRRAEILGQWRQALVDGLTTRGIRSIPSQTSFVLTQVGAGVHQGLQQRGIAVRRCDTFPGLDNTWIRIAVRPPDYAQQLWHALDSTPPQY